MSLLISAATAADSDPIFSSSEVFELTLEGPFSLIDSERDKTKRYDGQLSYVDGARERVFIDLNFEARGNWRLKKQNCRYAQLWLDLKKSQTVGTIFEDQNKLKLVVQCGGHRSYEQFLLKEQLAYDFFAKFTDYYFDTRVLNVNYVDSEKTGNNRVHSAYLIEHQKRLADRFEFETVTENLVSPGQLNSLHSNLVALFMFLIGNTDYSVIQGPVEETCCHNSKLLGKSMDDLFAFPFDFDNSGFVSASYAAGPSPNIGTRSTRERVFRGYCMHADTLDDALAIARNTEESILSLVDSSQLLTNSVKKRASRFLSGFYEVINDPEKTQRQLRENCRE